MKKLRALIGLPVLETESGQQLGEVQEVLINVVDAVVSEVDISSEQVISFEKVQCIGPAAVMVSNRMSLADRPDKPSNECHCLTDLCGKAVLTECGLQLGIISDLVYNECTGEVTAYELSDGLISDFISGLKVMPFPQIQVVGKDRLIVPECMAKLVHV
ncbi:MAG: PRC-barrel domain-containing protein [Pelosinus sp.]|nr:PRC-barrel domain-containing protein [Pelosinus sp.]